jgi:hypothetical protein
MVGRLGFSPAAMAARHSAGWDAGGWRGSSRGASTGRCGAAGAPGWGQEALYRRVDGEAERAAELELRRRCGPAIPVKETGIGSLGELRRVARVLFVLRIGNGEQRWRLSTVGSGGGEGPVKGVSSGKRECCGLGCSGE